MFKLLLFFAYVFRNVCYSLLGLAETQQDHNIHLPKVPNSHRNNLLEMFKYFVCFRDL